jgi:NAD-dependent SIR2 family protein deacetylase
MTHNKPLTLRHCEECGKPIRSNAFAHRKPENKLILLCQKCKLGKQIGNKNPNWKGEKAGYRAKRHRIERLARLLVGEERR